jgi:hypothetical protein
MGKAQFWHLFNKDKYPRTPEGLQKYRMDICNSCPEIIEPTKQCRQCGCFMLLKTQLEHATCPLNKW